MGLRSANAGSCAVMTRLRGGRAKADKAAGIGAHTGLTLRQKANRFVMGALAVPSFPVELCSFVLPVQAGTHAAMLFRRTNH